MLRLRVADRFRDPQLSAQHDKREVGVIDGNLASHVTRVQTARYGCVCRAFNDGAPVGEESHLKWFMPEFQHEVVMPYGAVGCQAAVHVGEVDGSLPLMDLHRIPAAERDVRTAFASQMNEVAFATGPAVGTGIR